MILSIDKVGIIMAEHSGHRQRLMKKLKEDKLTKHEYLEMLLFNAMPRRNTNDLAHRLYSEFGSVKNVLNASYERLIQVDGVGESVALYIVCLGKILQQCENEKQDETPCTIAVYEYSTFLTFIKQEYAHLQHERLDVYLLDADSKIIGRKSSSIAHAGEVLVAPEFFVDLFKMYSPSGIVLVHNHPKGSCTPSNVDNLSTSRVQELCKIYNILFCEHFVYGLDGVYSYVKNKRVDTFAGNG